MGIICHCLWLSLRVAAVVSSFIPPFSQYFDFIQSLILPLHTHSSCTWHIFRTEPAPPVSDASWTFAGKKGPFIHDGVPKITLIWGPWLMLIFTECVNFMTPGPKPALKARSLWHHQHYPTVNWYPIIWGTFHMLQICSGIVSLEKRFKQGS